LGAATPEERSQQDLVRLERAYQARFRDLEIAETRDQPPHVLDRMCERYLAALDAYTAAAVGSAVSASASVVAAPEPAALW